MESESSLLNNGKIGIGMSSLRCASHMVMLATISDFGIYQVISINVFQVLSHLES